MERILLASSSPRRKALFRQVGLPFRAVAPRVDEERGLPDGAVPRVRALATRKAMAVLPAPRFRWVLGCDTLVEIDGQILGKPADREDAGRMLAALSGREHHVHTGLALYVARDDRWDVTSATTVVRFRDLDAMEIHRYLGCGEWRGVAGAYRIQGRGESLVDRIGGAYSNVVGLPLSLFCGILGINRYPFPAR